MLVGFNRVDYFARLDWLNRLSDEVALKVARWTEAMSCLNNTNLRDSVSFDTTGWDDQKWLEYAALRLRAATKITNLHQGTRDAVDMHKCNLLYRSPIDNAGTKLCHRLFPGDDRPRKFVGCNLINCEPPPGSIVEYGNTAIIEYGVVTSTERIGGVPVDHHANIVHGRWTPRGIEYKDTPVVIQID